MVTQYDFGRQKQSALFPSIPENDVSAGDGKYLIIMNWQTLINCHQRSWQIIAWYLSSTYEYSSPALKKEKTPYL